MFTGRCTVYAANMKVLHFRQSSPSSARPLTPWSPKPATSFHFPRGGGWWRHWCTTPSKQPPPTGPPPSCRELGRVISAGSYWPGARGEAWGWRRRGAWTRGAWTRGGMGRGGQVTSHTPVHRLRTKQPAPGLAHVTVKIKIFSKFKSGRV